MRKIATFVLLILFALCGPASANCLLVELGIAAGMQFEDGVQTTHFLTGGPIFCKDYRTYFDQKLATTAVTCPVFEGDPAAKACIHNLETNHICALLIDGVLYVLVVRQSERWSDLDLRRACYVGGAALVVYANTLIHNARTLDAQQKYRAQQQSALTLNRGLMLPPMPLPPTIRTPQITILKF